MILIDTGPLVAFLSRKDSYYEWADRQFQIHPFPFFTCQPVLTETAYFLQKEGVPLDGLYKLLKTGIVEIQLNFESQLDSIFQLTMKYKDQPMDLADACLVRMAELHPQSKILTIDSDFTIYRKHRNQVLDVIMPE